MPSSLPDRIETEEQLEELLVPAVRGRRGVPEASLSGNVAIVGAGGKMGPSLARRIRRATDAAGRAAPRRRHLPLLGRRASPAASRPTASTSSRATCSIRQQVAALPRFDNVLFLAGMKFGASAGPT